MVDRSMMILSVCTCTSGTICFGASVAETCSGFGTTTNNTNGSLLESSPESISLTICTDKYIVSVVHGAKDRSH